MTYLLERLTTELDYPLLTDDAGLKAFATGQQNAVVFLPASPQRYPETLDVAVVLPELVKAFGGRLTPALAETDYAAALAATYGVTAWPALLLLRHGEYLGVITRMRDWDVYLHKINELLASSPVKAPGIGIPVVDAAGAASCQ